MRYLGGKSKLAKHILQAIGPIDHLWDPFCGGLSVSACAGSAGAAVIASDAHPALIALYTAIQDGWDPPETVTRETFLSARELSPLDPMHGFCAFGCAFGGKYWGGYACSAGRNYAAESRRALLRDVPLIASFKQLDFLSVIPGPAPRLTIYCDPPYQDTTGYSTGVFDHSSFFARCEEWARVGVPVYVSEYDIQRPGWSCVWESTYKPGLRGSQQTKTDRLYRVLSSPDETQDH